MDSALEQLQHLAPALLFLVFAVPLADLLERLGFFEAVVASLSRRAPDALPVWWLWLLAAVTTAVLNLDTAIVLLTPLYLGLARRAGVDRVGVALVPLLLASLASSFLVVSNLTTIIVAEGVGLDSGDVARQLGAPSVVAVVVGWLAYRRRHATVLVLGHAADDPPGARRSRRIGGVVVATMLLGFVVGERVGVAPWLVVAAADVALACVTRSFPWRRVPVVTAAGVAAVGVVVAAVPVSAMSWLGDVDGALATFGTAWAATGVAAGVNNLPAALLVGEGSSGPGPGLWSWLLGINVGAVLVPTAALANLLWLGVMAAEGEPVSWRGYLRRVVPVALPACAAAFATLALTIR